MSNVESSYGHKTNASSKRFWPPPFFHPHIWFSLGDIVVPIGPNSFEKTALKY